MTAKLVHTGKRWLYLLHRWLGIAACLLFLIWFVSGLVMVYVPFPALTEQERIAGLPEIDWARVTVSAPEAERLASPAAPPEAMTLEMTGDGPVWRIRPRGGPTATLSAESGQPIPAVERETALRTAEAFARVPAAGAEAVARDQWTVAGRYDPDRPLWRVRLAGPGQRDLYVSGTSGAVVLDTDAHERFWNWLGSVPHWIYPTVLRQHPEAWRQMILWASGPAILVAVTGLWIGLLRLRLGRRRFPGRRITPYRGWMEWHHLAGLVGGLLLTLWIFSGWLSVDPWRLFETPGIRAEGRWAYADAGRLAGPGSAALASAAAGARQVEFGWAAGHPLVVVRRASDQSVLDASTLTPARLDEGELAAAAARLLPEAPIRTVGRLSAPDLYWYAVAEEPKLPVLRIRFADPGGTWVHIDPETGTFLGSIDRRGRVYRILYDLFHKWDLNILTLNRPAWDLFLWLFSLAGIVTSATAIRIGWQRLRHRPRQRRPAS